jgi:DNA invertase Pin-like site-specific DNA recombinase
MSSSPVRVVAYLRCSTSEQRDEGMSLEAQEGAIRAWALAHGAEVVDVVTDGAVSGTRALADREGGAKIMALLDARKPVADAVAVIRTDRLGRDAAERLALYKRFRTGRVGLVSIRERIDLATPHGRAMAAVSAVFSALERDLIAERTSDALTELRRQGRVWNHPPFGWAAQDGRLVSVPAEQDTLARIRELRDEGMSYARVAVTLTAEGRPTKRGGKWAAATVHSVLNAQPDGVPAGAGA